VIDLREADFDYVQMKLAPEFANRPDSLLGLIPSRAELVLTGLDRASDVRWAMTNGIKLGRGRALAR